MSAFTQWQQRTYPGGSSAPEITPATGSPFFRDGWDEARSAFARRTPEAQYPDGYLSPPMSRRDRAIDGAASNAARKPTDRGVHRDAAMQAEDYLWPDEFNLMSGIEYESVGMQYVSPALVLAAGLDTTAENTTTPERLEELRKLLPQWTSGGPGMAVVNHMES